MAIHSSIALLLAGTAAILAAAPAAAGAVQASAGACGALAARTAWPARGTRLISATWHEAGPLNLAAPPGMPPMPPLALPAHCEVIGSLHERVAPDGQQYAIKFHVRLPQHWNGKFLMQGGGGTEGDLGDAVGRLGMTGPSALAEGYAVLSQDSGHDNAVNTVPAKGGASAFGFDPQARADYGGQSLRPAVEAAKAAVRGFYGRVPRHSYFVGCSKGGQEGMMLATRYPDLFDGIAAGAPGFALPRAAVAEMWDTQALAGVAKANGQPLTVQSLAQAFSAGDYALVRKSVLAACDSDDGAADGIVGAFAQCTSEKVLPQLAKVSCAGAKQDGCLSGAQVEALRRIHDGAKNSKGEPLYAGFYWDGGWGDIGWQVWKSGAGPMPAINVLMGAPALASIFTVPPTGLADDVQAKLQYALSFDFDRDAPRIYATGSGFTRSAWTDIGARTTTLDAFRKRGGRLIVSQGASDPVFSLEDTVNWFKALDKQEAGRAASFVRLFAVPGMVHCAGGPATDGYDTLTALVEWAEHARAPESLEAKAGPRSPWPGRTRPLCSFPRIARYKGSGSLEEASSFTCA